MRDKTIGMIIGGVTPTAQKVLIEHTWWTDWVQPITISAICSIIGLLIMHYGKKLLTRLDRREPKWKQNGKR